MLYWYGESKYTTGIRDILIGDFEKYKAGGSTTSRVFEYTTSTNVVYLGFRRSNARLEIGSDEFNEDRQ